MCGPAIVVDPLQPPDGEDIVGLRQLVDRVAEDVVCGKRRSRAATRA